MTNEEKVKELIKELNTWEAAKADRNNDLKYLSAPTTTRTSLNWQQAEAHAKELTDYEAKKSSLEAARDTAKANIERLTHEIGQLLPIKNKPVNMIVDDRTIFVTYKSDKYGEKWTLTIDDYM